MFGIVAVDAQHVEGDELRRFWPMQSFEFRDQHGHEQHILTGYNLESSRIGDLDSFGRTYAQPTTNGGNRRRRPISSFILSFDDTGDYGVNATIPQSSQAIVRLHITNARLRFCQQNGNLTATTGASFCVFGPEIAESRGTEPGGGQRNSVLHCEQGFEAFIHEAGPSVLGVVRDAMVCDGQNRMGSIEFVSSLFPHDSKFYLAPDDQGGFD
jgi:hypothetical protein